VRDKAQNTSNDDDVESILSKTESKAESLKTEISAYSEEIEPLKKDLDSSINNKSEVINGQMRKEFHLWFFIISLFLVFGLLVSYFLGIYFSLNYKIIILILLPVFSLLIFALLFIYNFEYTDFKNRITGLVNESTSKGILLVKTLESKNRKIEDMTLIILRFLGNTFPIYRSTMDSLDFSSRLETEKRSLRAALRVYDLDNEDLISRIEFPATNVIKQLMAANPREAILSIIKTICKTFRFEGLNSEETENILKFAYFERLGSIERENLLKEILKENKARLFLEQKISQKIKSSRIEKLVADGTINLVHNHIKSRPSFNLENLISTVLENLYLRSEFLSDLRDFSIKFHLDKVNIERLFNIINKEHLEDEDNFRDITLSRFEADVRELIISGLPEQSIKTLFELEMSRHPIYDWQTAKEDKNFRKGLVTILQQGGFLDTGEKLKFVSHYEDILEYFTDYNLKEICEGLIGFHSLVLYEIEIQKKLAVFGILRTIQTDSFKAKAVYISTRENKLQLENIEPYAQILKLLTDFTGNQLKEVSNDKREEFSEFLSAILINFDNSVQSTVKYMKINRELAGNKAVSTKLYNFLSTTGSDIRYNDLERIMKSFNDDQVPRDEAPFFDKFLNYLSSSGFIPSYQGLFASSLEESRKAVSELSSEIDHIDSVRHDFLSKLVNTEISEKYRILLRGHMIEAYLLNADTKGKAFEKMGDEKLEKFRHFLEEYSKVTGDLRFRPSNFLFTRMAGKASRIGVVPSNMTFEEFSTLFEVSVKKFAKQEHITSNLYISKIEVLSTNLKVVPFDYFVSENYLDKIGTIVNEDFDTKRKVELVSILNAGEISSITVKNLLIRKIDEIPGGLFEFLSEQCHGFLKKFDIGQEEFKPIDLELRKAFKSQTLSGLFLSIGETHGDSNNRSDQVLKNLQISIGKNFPDNKISEGLVRSLSEEILTLSAAARILR
jgi:hypothetical protein